MEQIECGFLRNLIGFFTAIITSEPLLFPYWDDDFRNKILSTTHSFGNKNILVCFMQWKHWSCTESLRALFTDDLVIQE